MKFMCPYFYDVIMWFLLWHGCKSWTSLYWSLASDFYKDKIGLLELYKMVINCIMEFNSSLFMNLIKK